MFRVLSVLAVTALLVAGCGRGTGDRALSGAGLGAAGGAGVSAITGGNIGTGALLGGLAGGAVGAITDEDDINLGCPWWRSRC